MTSQIVPHRVIKGTRRRAHLSLFILLSVLANTSLVSCASPRINNALTPGVILPGNILLQRGQIFPYEAMSATSQRCALVLLHLKDGQSLFLFPKEGEDEGSWLELGDSYAADGQRKILDGNVTPPPFIPAVEQLKKTLAPLSIGELNTLCHRLDPGKRPSKHAMVLIWLGFFLVLTSWIFRQSRPKLASATFFLAALSFLLAVIPVLLHLSYGSQEVQRLLSAALPREHLIQGHHGDLRHPRGLFLVYGAIVHFFPSIVALRILGFTLFATTLAVWGFSAWKENFPSCVMGIALLLHPCLLINVTEVGPLAFYSSGVLLLLLFTQPGRMGKNAFFVAAMATHLIFSAINVVGFAVGITLFLGALVRDRGQLTRTRLAWSLGGVILLSLPFAMDLWRVVAADMPLRNAAEYAPAVAWGARPFSVIRRGLVLGLLGSSSTGWLVGLGCMVYVVRTRNLLNMGNVLVLLSLALVTVLTLLSGTVRVQPAYAAYGVPLLFVGLGQLANRFPDKIWGKGFTIVFLLVMTYNFVGLYPSLSSTHPGTAPEELVARTLKERGAQCQVLLAASHDLVVPLVPHLDDLSNPIAPPHPIEGSLQSIPGARQRTASPNGLKLTTLFVRHQMPDDVTTQFLTALEELVHQGCTHALYDTRMPMPDLYAHLTKRCSTPMIQPPYALFQCDRNHSD